MDDGLLREFSLEQAENLFIAQKFLADLAGHQATDVDGSVNGLYRALGAASTSALRLGLGDLALLSREAQAVVDRIRAHRLPLSERVLSILREAVELAAEAEQGVEPSRLERVLVGLTTSLADAHEDAPGDPSEMDLFIDESREQLDACAQALSQLDGDPARDVALVNEAFRSLHTFKGNCGLLGFARLEGLARVAEDALDGLRSNELAPTHDLCSAVLRLLQAAQRALLNPDETGAIARDEVLLAAEQARQRAKETRLGELLIAKNLVGHAQIRAALAWKARPLGEVLVELQALSPEQLDLTLIEQRRLRVGEQLSLPPGVLPVVEPDTKLVQVQGARLEQLLALVSELARVAAQLGQERHLGDELQDLATRVQDAGERVRLMPLSRAFKRLELLVADLARRQGKRIELFIEGQEIEAERPILETLSTLLLHAARNAVDHGVEPEPERLERGKPPVAAIRLVCSAEADYLKVTLSDDGRGLDRQRILARALELGLPSPGEQPSDEQILALIFEPGFSTAARVTDSSGRGVGMDAVRAKVLASGGSVRLSSPVGRGTTVEFRLPVTLLYVPGCARHPDVQPHDEAVFSSGTWRIQKRANAL